MRVLSLAACLLVLGACDPGAEPPATPSTRVTGTWVAGDGEFKIQAVTDSTLRIEFRGQYEHDSPDGPMANVGTGEGTATLVGDRALFRPEGAEEECSITLAFAGERMEAAQEGTCGFGLNVTADGDYRRASRAEPRFGLP